MRRLLYAALITITLLGLMSCGGGQSGTLMGRVVDGFGNPLGGEYVMVTLSGNPAVHRPDQYGNFIVRAPTGSYTMRISFSNPAAGFNFRLDENIDVVHGSKQLGTFTLLSVQNSAAWERYRAGDYSGAAQLFNEQANIARAGAVWLPYMRYIEGEEGQNTLLTQGVLSAENGLGWCLSRGSGNHQEGMIHFEQSLFGGYNNYDAFVGMAGVALGEGDPARALELLQQTIDEPGLYDSTQIHDNVKEVDLIACKALAQFMLGQDGYSRDTMASISDEVATDGNTGSVEILGILDTFL